MNSYKRKNSRQSAKIELKNKLKTRVDEANKEKSVSSSSVSSFGFFCLDEIERENSHPTEYDTEEYGDEEENEE